MQPIFGLNNFPFCVRHRLYSKFDPDSVMLYGSRAFTTNPANLTIVKKDGSLLPEVHEKSGLSKDDINRINSLYGCNDTVWPSAY